MAYFNDDSNASFYSVSGGDYSYPPPTQTFVTDTEVVYNQTCAGQTVQWIMVRRSGPILESPTSLPATASFESVTPATSYMSRTDGHWPSYDRVASYRQTQSYQSSNWSRDASFASTAASEGSTVAHTPSSSEYPLEVLDAHQLHTVPLNYQGANQSGASSGMSYVGNVNTFRRPRAVPVRAETTQMEWHQPYGVARTHLDLYKNAEAGPSTLVAPPIPYISQPTTRPSGGISETTADANKQTITEEHRSSRRMPKRVRVPNGQGDPRPSHALAERLCDWVRRRSSEPPTFNQALAAAVKVIREKREPVYSEPHLRSGKSGRTVLDSKKAEQEYERRTVDRRLYEKLSRYYPLPLGGKKEWARPPLLAKVLDDLTDLEARGYLEECFFDDLVHLEHREGL